MISVLIRTLNRPEYLQDAIQSVLNQSYRPLEVVVVNDGGDSVADLVSDQLKGSDVSWQYSDLFPGQGRSAAANKALELATGEALLFLDDDDWIAADHLSRLHQALAESEQLVAVYSDTACVSRNAPDDVIRLFDSEYDSARLAYENYLPIHSVLFKRGVVREHGCRFDDSLDLYEDWHFWIQVSAVGEMKRVPGVSAYYSMDLSGVGGQSERDFSAEKTRFLRVAMADMSDQQLNYISHAAIALQRANKKVDELVLECDNQTLLIERQKYHLDKWEMTEKDRVEQSLRQEKELSQILNELQVVCDQQSGKIDKLLARISDQEQAKAESDAAVQRMAEEVYQLRTAVYDALHESRTSRVRTVYSKLKVLAPKVKRKLRTLLYLIRKGDFRAVKQQLEVNYRKFFMPPQVTVLPESVKQCSEVGIVSTPHTMYVARMISTVLSEFGIQSTILDQNTTVYDDSLHIVICPQMFDKLPGYYIAFQMEQSVSSRWFTDDYVNILENSLAIMEYSHQNIEYLQHQQGLSYKQIYYTPVSNIGSARSATNSACEKEYDVVFYGDINNERRKQFIDKLSEEFSVLVISNTFGDELYNQLQRGSVVVNIHYYENALLETTRIHECLSLGLRVVSETSSDIDEHKQLEPYVRFTEIGNVEAMIEAVRDELSAIGDNQKSPVLPPEDICNFRYFFGRMLVSLSILDIEKFDRVEGILTAAEVSGGLALSLPETYDRYWSFADENPQKKIFPGMRHTEGWKGCALSYRYMARQALRFDRDYLEVWEDDVMFEGERYSDWLNASEYFAANMDRFDMLSGLIADVADDTEILDAFDVDGHRYAVIDKMTSTVCNVYGKKVLSLLANWDLHNPDVHTNTIDRYLQQRSLRVLVPVPFIAGHRPEKDSTLWGFSNTTYDDMILESEKKLQRKVDDFLNRQ